MEDQSNQEVEETIEQIARQRRWNDEERRKYTPEIRDMIQEALRIAS